MLDPSRSIRGRSRPLRIAPSPYPGPRPHPTMQKGGLSAPSPFTPPVALGLVVVQHLRKSGVQGLHLIPGEGHSHLWAVQRGVGMERDASVPVTEVLGEHHGAVVGFDASHRLHRLPLVSLAGSGEKRLGNLACLRGGELGVNIALLHGDVPPVRVMLGARAPQTEVGLGAQHHDHDLPVPVSKEGVGLPVSRE